MKQHPCPMIKTVEGKSGDQQLGIGKQKSRSCGIVCYCRLFVYRLIDTKLYFLRVNESYEPEFSFRLGLAWCSIANLRLMRRMDRMTAWSILGRRAYVRSWTVMHDAGICRGKRTMGYAPREEGVGAASFCSDSRLLSDEHGMYFARRLPVSGYPLTVPRTCHAVDGLQ